MGLNVYTLCVSKDNAFLNYPVLQETVGKLTADPTCSIEIKDDILQPRNYTGKADELFHKIATIIRSLIHNIRKYVSEKYALNFRNAALKIHRMAIKQNLLIASTAATPAQSLQAKNITVPEDKVANLKSEIEKAEQIAEELKKEIDKLGASHQDALKQQKALEERIQCLDEDKPQAYNLADEPIESLEQKKKANEGEIEKLKQELVELEGKKYGYYLSLFQLNLKKQISDKKEKIQILDGKIFSLDLQIDLATSYMQANRKIEKLSNGLPELKKKTDQLGLAYEIAKKHMGRIEKMLEGKKADLNLLLGHQEKTMSMSLEMALPQAVAVPAEARAEVLTPLALLKKALKEAPNPGKEIVDLLMLAFDCFPEDAVKSFKQVDESTYRIIFNQPQYFANVEKKAVTCFGHNPEKIVWLTVGPNTLSTKGLTALVKLPLVGWKEGTAQSVTYLPASQKFDLCGKLGITKTAQFTFEQLHEKWQTVKSITAEELEKLQK